VPKKTAITDDSRIRDLLMWARKQRIVVSTISVGDVHMTVADLGMAGEKKTAKTDEERKANLYEQYGGKPLQDAAAIEEANSTYDEDGE